VAEKDQAPTPKRLRDARKRGEVVFSHDLASSAVFLFVVLALWLAGATLFSLWRELWLHATSEGLFIAPDDNVPALLLHAGRVLVITMVGLAAISAAGGLVGSFAQVGGLLAWERIKPDMNRLNPAEGFQKIFSTRNLVNLLKMLLKTALLAAVMWLVIRGCLDTALKLGYATPSAALSVGASLVLQSFAWAGLVYALMAGVDYAHTRYEFIKGLRMSIEEVRREHKDSEGDPINRSRRRSAHFEAVYASLADRVRMASAVIHSQRVAVALQYLGEHDLPRVLARGEAELAAQIRRVASEGLIPMAFDPQLAERLYDEVPQDRPIPRSLYAPVARLLQWAQGDN
jgi:type III secretion protein U